MPFTQILALLLAQALCACTDADPQDSGALTTSETDGGAPEPGVTTLAELEAGTGGMEVDPAGDILMGDFGMQLSGGEPGSGVYRITADGQVSLFASGIDGASGNAMAADGTLMQSDIARGEIVSIAPDGSTDTVASGISGPVGIAIGRDGDDDDDLYVAACGSNSIVKVGGPGIVTTFAEDDLLSCPNGIALASDGNFYVSNFYDNQLLRVDPDGQVSAFVELEGNNLGHVTWGNERLYVAVRGNHQLVEVSLDGTITPLVGTGDRGGDDGALDEATLSYPNDLALSADGHTLYFNDVRENVPGSNNIGPSVVRALVLPSDD